MLPLRICAPAGAMPRTALPTMVLPAPDSPTRPCTSPGITSMSTPRRIGVRPIQAQAGDM